MPYSQKRKEYKRKYEHTPQRKTWKKEYYSSDKWVQYNKRRLKKYYSTPAGKRSLWNTELKRTYGITADYYEQMLVKQNGICKICKNIPGKKRLAVDHNHITGKIRGLLCNKCNTALGLVKEDPKILAKMIKYLKL